MPASVQGQGAPVPYAHQIALIPSSRMEFPIQRRWAAAIFVLLQTLKISDLWKVYTAAYPEQYNGILMKWFLIDAAYLIALYIAKIPWLQFSLLKTILLSFFMFWVDFMLFAMPIVSLSINCMSFRLYLLTSCCKVWC